VYDTCTRFADIHLRGFNPQHSLECHIPSSPSWHPSTYTHTYSMRRISCARKTIRHVRRTKASLHLDSYGSSTRILAASWAFNRRCPFSFLTPLRGRVISAPVSLFFSTGARPSERSTYRRKNPLTPPFNCGLFHLRRLSSFSDDQDELVSVHNSFVLSAE